MRPPSPNRLHKFGKVAMVVASILLCQLAHATLVLDESFNYTDGSLNGQGGWTVSGGTAPATVEAGNLDVSGLPASTGKRIQMDGTAGTFTRGDGSDTLTTTVSNGIYFSYILHITDIASYTTTYETVSEISIAGNFLCLIQMKDNGGGKVKFATRRATGGTPTSGSSNPTPFATNDSIFIVGKWEVNTGGNDVAKLWVDPSSATFGAASDPTTDATSTSGGTDPSNGAVFGGFRFTSGIGAEIDSLRIGRTWADVTSAGVAPVGVKLAFTTPPAGAAPGATMSPVVVRVQSGGGVNVASNGVPVTLTLTAGSGILGGTLTQNTDGSGAATFSNLSIDTAGTGKQLTAAASGIGTGLTNAVSSSFIIADSTATKLAFTTQPTNALVNATMNSIVVQIQDANSLAVASNNVPITLTLSSGSGILGGTATVNSDATGKATFSTLTINTAGAGKQFTAAASGIGAGLTSATSGTFAITNAPVIPTTGGTVITQALVNVAGVILRGTNGSPNGSYQVLNSSNVTLPGAQWASIATNVFSSGGSFDCTNPPAPFSPSFYRLLSIVSAPSVPSNNIMGFAYGTTGGGDTTNIVVATNTASLSNALVRMAGPLIIQVQGTIALRTDQNTPVVGGNKTIIGIGTNAGITGDLIIEDPLNSNVIIRNLHLSNPNATGGDKDAITISHQATNVWVDHCDIYDCVDGGLDVVHGADFVTVSWCKFYYDVITTHQNVNLIGNNDNNGAEDTGTLHVTFHHNWWSSNCVERMPSVRFGRGHIYNNYFNTTGGTFTNNYCVRTRLFAEVRVENNYFENVNDPWERFITPANTTDLGKLFATNNTLVNVTWNTNYDNGVTGATVEIPVNETVFNPATNYTYTLDASATVAGTVTNNAGAGRGPFAP